MLIENPEFWRFPLKKNRANLINCIVFIISTVSSWFRFGISGLRALYGIIFTTKEENNK